MRIATIRRFTADDEQRVNASALRFAARHHLDLNTDDYGSPMCALTMELLGCFPDERHPLASLWQGCLCRALRVPRAMNIVVAYGYVGRYA